MIRDETLERAAPGRENAKDWLTLKIVECSVEPMDEKIAERLAIYNNAYNALCQWENTNNIDQKQLGPNTQEKVNAEHLTTEMAKKWTEHMENADGTNGAHWSIDQAKQVMAQRGLSFSPNDFWVVLNMIYSDYSQIARKYNVGSNIEFYVDMAKAFLNDKDSQNDKIVRYYNYIVRS